MTLFSQIACRETQLGLGIGVKVLGLGLGIGGVKVRLLLADSLPRDPFPIL